MDADDEDVVVCLDGDDWLNGEGVFSRLNEIYEKEDCWLTYGSYMQYPDGRDSSFHVCTSCTWMTVGLWTVAEVARLWPNKPISGEIGYGAFSSPVFLRIRAEISCRF